MSEKRKYRKPFVTVYSNGIIYRAKNKSIAIVDNGEDSTDCLIEISAISNNPELPAVGHYIFKNKVKQSVICITEQTADELIELLKIYKKEKLNRQTNEPDTTTNTD